MRSKLEEKLAELEKSSPISNDKELIKALNKIIDETVPVNESDTMMINEAVEMLFELEGVDVDAVKQAAEECSARYLKDRGMNRNIATVSALEAKLCEMDINNDQELRAALKEIIDNTVPENERDVELIDEAVEFLLELEGVDIEEINQAAEAWGERYLAERTDRFKTSESKKKSCKMKKLLPLVAAIMAVLLLGLCSFRTSFNIFEIVDKYIKDIFQMTSSNDEILGITNNYREYDTYEDLIANENNIDILWPHALNSQIYDGKILLMEYDDYTEININISSCNCIIKVRLGVDNCIKEKDTTNIDGYDVYITEYNDRVQGELEFNGNYYRIKVDSYSDLEMIINNME